VGSTRANGWLRSSAPNERTTEILEERRRRPTRILDRGWLVRRALLAADVVGLLLAFLIVQLALGVSIHLADRYNSLAECGLFVAAIPLWVVAAKLYGLYDRDEERADGTTADDLIGVLHVLTIGTWLVFAVASLFGLGNPHTREFLLFWGLAILLVTLARAGTHIARSRHKVNPRCPCRQWPRLS
jgi:hypothetical protein